MVRLRKGREGVYRVIEGGNRLRKERESCFLSRSFWGPWRSVVEIGREMVFGEKFACIA